jgi:acyl phosphate:glycerol-3-phosphate acyltransferase
VSTLVFAILGYLLGSIPFAVISSRVFGLPDPRTYGSGNPGATNVLRTGRKGAAAMTLIGDAAKGWVAVALAQWLGPRYGVEEGGIAAVALAAFLGHLYSVFLGFKGGKGVATAAGVLMALGGWLGISAIATWGVVAAVWRISSLAALVTAVLAPVYAALFLGPGVATAAVATIAALLVWRHRSNIKNLLSGTEDTFSARESQGGKGGG